MDITLVFTTVDSQDAAHALAQKVVERRLAACVQTEPIQSTYRWEGRVQHASEWRLMAKTTPQRAPEVQAAWRELHPYEVPAIWSVAAQVLSPDFAAWLAAETREEASGLT